MIKLIVFDLDGTLLDTKPDLTGAMNYALSQLGYEQISAEQTRDYIGNGIKMFAKRAVSHSYETDTDDEIADKAVALFKQYYAGHLVSNTVPYDGISELLYRLKEKGIRLAVLSNKYDDATKYIIDHFFPDTFDRVYGESEACPRKPDPAGFYLICNDLGISPSDAVMVGDSPGDIKVAVASGARHVSVAWGYRSREVLEGAGAYRIASDADGLYDMLIHL